MKTDKLWINGMTRRNNEVNDILQEFAANTGITGRDFLHMNLLTEETLGMAGQSLADFDGEIWLESIPQGYEIILEADVHETPGEAFRKQDSPDGLMKKIAEMLHCSYAFDDPDEIPEGMKEMLPDYFSYGIREERPLAVWTGKWSLSAYRRNLLEHRSSSQEAGNLLNELEQSIVATLSKEVTIGIRGHKIRLVITGELEEHA